MTDALVIAAVREDCVAALREHVKLRDLLLVAASTAVFARALAVRSHWLWWVAGVPAAISVVLLLGWLVAYLLLPRRARSRLRHLPHRTVTVDLLATGIAFQTATERLEVAWSELRALKRRPSFWIVCLRAGARIPLPIAALPDGARSLLEAKLQQAAPPTMSRGATPGETP